MRTVVRSGFLLLVVCLIGLAGAPAAGAQPTRIKATTWSC